MTAAELVTLLVTTLGIGLALGVFIELSRVR